MNDGPTWADYRALEKRLDFLERQSGRQPLREAGGGGRGSVNRPSFYLFNSYEDMVANTPGYRLGQGDFGLPSDEIGHRHLYILINQQSAANAQWYPITTDFLVGTLADLLEGTWSEGDVIRTVGDVKQSYRIVNGDPVPYAEFTAATEAALDALVTSGDIPDGSFCRTTTVPLASYRVIDGHLEPYTEIEATTTAALNALIASGNIPDWSFCRTTTTPATYRVVGGELVEYPSVAKWVNYSGE